jgi:tetratricopeptide (TPR) repeat protein
MPEITVASLDPQLQKQVESARSALDRGRPEQTLELCQAVLSVQPDCLQVRKMERAAQLKFAAIRRGLVAKLVTAVSSAPFLLSGNLKLKDDPRSALATAERLLRRDPHSVAALNLLGQAATELGWLETAVFAHETASDLEPDRIDLLLSLGRAYLAASRASDAVNAAKQALQLHPENSDAQTLLQNALVAATVVNGKWDKESGPQNKVPGK